MSATRALALLSATALLLLTGCGGADHGDADVAFAQGMIPHHGQAVEMAELALEKSDDAQVQTLATEVKAAQDPEIDTMSGWLEEWGETVPDPAAHHSGSSSMPGMMTSEDMDALAQASGDAFDRLWLEQMVRHHEGAVEMAEQEQADGSYEPAVELAGEIADTQRAEIEQMQVMLAG